MAHYLVTGHSPTLPAMTYAALGGGTSLLAGQLLDHVLTESQGYTLTLSNGDKVTLLRHMLAIGPADKTRRADLIRLPSPEGMLQAAARQQELDGFGYEFDNVYSSPFVRALVMGAICGRGKGVEVLPELGYPDGQTADGK